MGLISNSQWHVPTKTKLELPPQYESFLNTGMLADIIHFKHHEIVMLINKCTVDCEDLLTDSCIILSLPDLALVGVLLILFFLSSQDTRELENDISLPSLFVCVDGERSKYKHTSKLKGYLVIF